MLDSLSHIHRRIPTATNPPAAYTHTEPDNDDLTKSLPFDTIKRNIVYGEKQMSLDQATNLLPFSRFYIGRVLEGSFLTTEKNRKDYIFFVSTPPPPPQSSISYCNTAIFAISFRSLS
jgi:hypothetical protein